MISHLVSSILNPSAISVAADKSSAHQSDDEKNRAIPSPGFAAKSVASRLDRVSVHQGGQAERVDYFHAAKKMIREALSDFAGGITRSFADIGLDDGMAEKFTKSMMRQTKDALLWGVGFSVKLMTATVSMNSDTEDDATRPSFNIMARSIEITVNHSDGVLDVATGNVSIESQFAGGPGAQQSHLLDIRDTDQHPTGNLTSALQALQNPRSLIADIDDAEGADHTSHSDAVLSPHQLDKLEQFVDQIDTPRVMSRPDYNSRILLSEMKHYRNDRDELITYLRLDALIPLTDKPAATVQAAPSTTRIAFT